MRENLLYEKTAIGYCEIGDFTDIQAVGNSSMYERYDSVYSVVMRAIDEKYRNFLAQPIFDQNTDRIVWHVKGSNQTPRLLSDLPSEEKDKYLKIKQQTLDHYQQALGGLDRIDRQILSNAIKYIDDQYICCGDDMVWLIIWGMTPDLNKNNGVGLIIFESKDQPKYALSFDAGAYGKLCIELDKTLRFESQYVLCQGDVPDVVANDGYRFDGWSPTALGFKVEGAQEFRAHYTEVVTQPVAEPTYSVNFTDDGNCLLDGLCRLTVNEGDVLTEDQIPRIIANSGYQFSGWSRDLSLPITSDLNVEARCEVKPTYNYNFDAARHGAINGVSQITQYAGRDIDRTEFPEVKANRGYQFVGWTDAQGDPYNGDNNQYRDQIFTAQYEKKIPWYKQLLSLFPFWGRGCLQWLIYALLLGLFIWLVFYLFRSCDSPTSGSLNGGVLVDPPAIVDGRDRVIDGGVGGTGGVGGGGVVDVAPITIADGAQIDNNGQILDGGQERPVSITDENGNLPENGSVAPIVGADGALPPIEKTPGAPSVVSDRLVIFFENSEADLNQFAKDFKTAYPDDKYSIIGCDYKTRMIVIQMPPNERNTIREQITDKVQGHNYFVVDESIFESLNSKQITSKSGWHLGAVNLKSAWSITKGGPDVVVAVIDDGIDPSHEMFKGRIYKPYNIFTKSNQLSKGKGHGTHVAGLAVGSDLNYDDGVSGVAPGCLLMPVQVFDNSISTFSTVASGIMYAIHEGAAVINVSVGPSFRGLDILPIESQREIAAKRFKNEERVWKHIISLAVKKNVVIVFAAGNDNVLAMMVAENRSNNTINVAAVAPNLSLTKFSNFGQGTHVSAPGEGVRSARNGGGAIDQDGTSMAAPIVAGAVALIRSINKEITAGQILAVLRSTGRSIGNNQPPLIQIDRALHAVKSGNIPPENALIDEGDRSDNSAQKADDDAAQSPSNVDDYAAIRQQIETLKRKISELEKDLPENKR